MTEWLRASANVWDVRFGGGVRVALSRYKDKWVAEIPVGGPVVKAPTADHALLALVHESTMRHRRLGSLGSRSTEDLAILRGLPLPEGVSPADPDQAWAIYGRGLIGGLISEDARIVLIKNADWHSYIYHGRDVWWAAADSTPAKTRGRTIEALARGLVLRNRDGAKARELARALADMPRLPTGAHSL